MKKSLFSFVSATLIAVGVNAQTWEVDPNHSSIMFNAKHSGISFINGRFMEFEATVEGGTPEDFTGAKVAFTAQVNSVSTGAEGRDKHLKNEDFFDMDNNPTITFVSSSFTKSGDNMYKVVGDLTMRGNTKEIELTANHIGSTKTRDERHKVGFQLTGSVDRTEFGVSGASGSVVPVIEIICNVEMAEKKVE
ncbi:MAG: YceI family protein [Cyclobacteriaceae bacterium]